MGDENSALPVAIEIGPDALEAIVTLRPDVEPQDVSAAGLRRALFEAGIPITADVRDRIETYLEALAGPQAADPFVIARGKLPEPGLAGTFGFTLSDHIFGTFFVRSGDTIGRLIQPLPGQTGFDVHCREIPLDPPEIGLSLGANVRVHPDGCTLLAAATGTISTAESVPTVRRALIIAGDLSQSDGDLALAGDVIVRGAIRDGIEVRAEGAILVEDAIHASRVAAGGNLFVVGGISGQADTQVEAGGAVRAHRCSGVTLAVGRDLHLGVECINAHVTVAGSLAGPKLTVVGGTVEVRGTMEARTIGCETGTVTSVEVGPSQDELERLPELRADQARAEKQHAAAAADLAALSEQGSLASAERERLTELTFEVAECEAECETLRGRLDAILCDPDGARRTPASLLVHEMIWAGTQIRIEDRSFTFQKNVRGPVRFDIDEQHADRPLRARNMSTGRVVYLGRRAASPVAAGAASPAS